MHFLSKIYICVYFLAILGVSGCYTPPTPKLKTTVKPLESTMAKVETSQKAAWRTAWDIIL